MKKSLFKVPPAVNPSIRQVMTHASVMLLSERINLLLEKKSFDTLYLWLLKIQKLKQRGQITEQQLFNLFAHQGTSGQSVFHHISSTATGLVIRQTLKLLTSPQLRTLCQTYNDDLALPIKLLKKNLNFTNKEANYLALCQQFHLATMNQSYDTLDSHLNYLSLLNRYPNQYKNETFINDLQIAWKALCNVRARIQHSDTHLSINHLSLTAQVQSIIQVNSLRTLMDAYTNGVEALELPMAATVFLELMGYSQATRRFRAGNCQEASNLVMHELIKLGCNKRIEMIEINPGDHVLIVIGRNPESKIDDIRTWRDGLIIDAWANNIYHVREWSLYLRDFAAYKHPHDNTEFGVTVPFDINRNGIKSIFSVTSSQYVAYRDAPSTMPEIFSYDWEHKAYLLGEHLLEQYGSYATKYLLDHPEAIGIHDPIESVALTSKSEGIEVTLNTSSAEHTQLLSLIEFMEFALLEVMRVDLQNLRHAMLDYLTSHPERLQLTKERRVSELVSDQLCVIANLKTIASEPITRTPMHVFRHARFKELATERLKKNFKKYHLRAVTYLQQQPQFKRVALQLICTDDQYFITLNSKTRIALPYKKLKYFAHCLKVQTIDKKMFYHLLYGDAMRDFFAMTNNNDVALVVKNNKLCLLNLNGDHTPISLDAIEKYVSESYDHCEKMLKHAHHTSTQCVNLSQQYIGNFVMQMLIIFLHQHPEVRHVNLSTTKISLTQLRELLSVPSLRQLDLSHVPIGDAGATLLTAHHHLTHLTLVDCGISTAGAKALVENSTRLNALNLCDNPKIDPTFLTSCQSRIHTDNIKLNTTPVTTNTTGSHSQVSTSVIKNQALLFSTQTTSDGDNEQVLIKKLTRKSEL